MRKFPVIMDTVAPGAGCVIDTGANVARVKAARAPGLWYGWDRIASWRASAAVNAFSALAVKAYDHAHARA